MVRDDLPNVWRLGAWWVICGRCIILTEVERRYSMGSGCPNVPLLFAGPKTQSVWTIRCVYVRVCDYIEYFKLIKLMFLHGDSALRIFTRYMRII